MKTFDYTIKDELGIHVRPAGKLVQLVKDTDSKVTISMDGKSAEATKLFAIMSLAVKCGNTITVTIEGGDEDATEKAVKEFFEANL